MLKWTELTLVDGEGYEWKGIERLQYLSEFFHTGGIHDIFVSELDPEDGPEKVDWTGFPVDLTKEEIKTLGTMTNRDEAGHHFTELYSAELINKLEAGGWIEISRPTHEATGIPYDQCSWHLQVTEKAQALF